MKYLNRVKWQKCIQDLYNDKVHLAGYSFCDYTDYQDEFVSTFYFLDTEKVNRIGNFIRENPSKTATIIFSKEIESMLKHIFPKANCISIDMEEYIEKEIHYYYTEGKVERILI